MNDDEPRTRGAGGTPGGIAEFFLGLVMVIAGGGLHRKAQKDFAKARKNAKQAGDAPNASQRIAEANQALGFLTSARADIIDP